MRQDIKFAITYLGVKAESLISPNSENIPIISCMEEKKQWNNFRFQIVNSSEAKNSNKRYNIEKLRKKKVINASVIKSH